MDDDQNVCKYDIKITESCMDQVFQAMTTADPGTEEYGTLCDNLDKLQTVKGKQKDDIRKDEQLELEKADKKSAKRFRIGELVVGAAGMVAVSLGTTVFKGWLDNRELIVGREVDEAEKEAKRESFKFFSKKI